MNDFLPAVPSHGGDLLAASNDYKIPLEEWLDLSTGINPDSFPIPDIPARFFQRLPQLGNELRQAVRQHYRCDHFAMASGSQRFIELLPGLRDHSRVAVPDVGYQEHAYHWRKAGHQLVFYNGFNPQSLQALIDAKAIDVAVVINPCNPTGTLIDRSQLLQWHQLLAVSNKWLVVDEAFMDLTPEQSLTDEATRPGLFVLRSVGKFYGLAGIRIGFLMAEEAMVSSIDQALGCWPVTGPSQYIAGKALQDCSWQENARLQLVENAHWMQGILREYLGEHIQWSINSGFFISLKLEARLAYQLYEHLARSGILVRLWPLADSRSGSQPLVSLLRFGLLRQTDNPGREKLAGALASFSMTPVV